MAENVLRARQGDTLDALLARERGLGIAAVPAVLTANPGLADLGIVLPLGTVVIVPADAPESATLPLVQLWD